MAKERKAGRAERGAEGAERKRNVLKLRQVGSGIGCPPAMRETLRALGFRRMNQVVERKDSPEVRGMIAKISHLVEVID